VSGEILSAGGFDFQFSIYNLQLERPLVTERELKDRTKNMALRVMRLALSLPKNSASEVLGRQIIRSATSVAANYRAACRARSRKDFVNKLGIVEEEADETQLWLEMIIEANPVKQDRVHALVKEVGELTAIFAASRMTARRTK
jgi:four helix bundle protein